MMYLDLSRYQSPLGTANKLARTLWGVACALFFRTSPRFCFGWRRFLLRCFGARLGKGARVYPSTRVWAPWNLEMGDHAWLAPDTDCYCVDRIRIGAHAVVSQYSFLCSATHDIEDPQFPLKTAPITIGGGAWVAADVFVGPGITIGQGAVVAARSTVLHDIEPWTVVGGNPAKALKRRVLRAKA